MVRHATVADIRRISLSFARAFSDDPLWRWFIPPDDFVGRMIQFGDGVLRHSAIPSGTVFTTDDGVSAAIWAEPGHQNTSEVETALAATFASCFGPNLERFLESANLMGTRRPAAAHWYLAGVATHPDWQGQGLATSLIRPILERCDPEQIPSYLEATKEKNVPFYRRLGFELTDTIDLPGGGPRLYLMIREPVRTQNTHIAVDRE